MKGLSTLLVGIVTLCAAPAFAQVSVVEKAKADLAAAGVQVENKACSDFEIAKLVAGRLASQGAGLLQKDCCGDGNDPNRSHCEYNGVWYAHDIVTFPGVEYDIAHDGGGANGPGWDGPSTSDISRYRSATSLGLTGLVPGQQPAPPPPPPPPPIVSGMDYSHALQEILDAQRAFADSQRALADAQQQLLTLTTNIDTHVTNMDRTFTQTLGSVSMFFGKYIAPAIGGYLIAKQFENAPQAAPAK